MIISITRGRKRNVKNQYMFSFLIHVTLQTPMSDIRINITLVIIALTNVVKDMLEIGSVAHDRIVPLMLTLQSPAGR